MPTETRIRVLQTLNEIDPASWDRLARGEAKLGNPFVSHAFLSALEDSGSATARSGWKAQHLVLEDGAGKPAGILPCYLKNHSQGEYVSTMAGQMRLPARAGSITPNCSAACPSRPLQDHG
jgi:predicted N-acyltransferase